MRWRDRLLAATGNPVPQPELEERFTVSDLAEYFTFQGNRYPLGFGMPQGPPGVPSESPPSDFTGMVRQVYDRSGIIGACLEARGALISEARFKLRNLSDRKMYGSPALLPLERPTPNQTAGDLLRRFDLDASLAGNGYRIRIGRELHWARPDWMHIVLGSNMAEDYEIADAPDATIVGYVYWPGGAAGKYKPRPFATADVAHYAPEPDPLARFRGTSWIGQVLREIDTHRQMTEHKAKFLERGVPPFALKYPETVGKGDQGREKQLELIEGFRAQQQDASRQWEALHLFGGVDPVPIGLNFRDMDFKAIQGASETQIASRARVPAAVLGISEGLQGSALNAGNFGQARRQFGEQFAYPSWRQMCEALASLVAVPAGSELWYDTTDVAFLHEDAKDAAEVLATQATAIRTLTDGGYEPQSAITAVTGGDLSLLQHTGLVPVQLQPPGLQDMNEKQPSAPAPTNGVN